MGSAMAMGWDSGSVSVTDLVTGWETATAKVKGSASVMVMARGLATGSGWETGSVTVLYSGSDLAMVMARGLGSATARGSAMATGSVSDLGTGWETATARG